MAAEKPRAGQFSTEEMLLKLVSHTIAKNGGGVVVDHNEARDDWHVGAEYGREAPDSPMAGAAVYGAGRTLREALLTAGKDAGLWTDEDADEGEVPIHVGSISIEGAKSFASDSPGWGAIGMQEIAEAVVAALSARGIEPPYQPTEQKEG